MTRRGNAQSQRCPAGAVGARDGLPIGGGPTQKSAAHLAVAAACGDARVSNATPVAVLEASSHHLTAVVGEGEQDG
jgi:hypothetical protein